MTIVYFSLLFLFFAVIWLIVKVHRLNQVLKITREKGSEHIRLGFDDAAYLVVSRHEDRDSEIYMKTSF